MTRILISSPVPSDGAHASSSESSTTTSGVAFTPSTDDASVISDGGVDPDVPVQFVESVEDNAQPPSVASIDTFDQSFTFRTPSPVAFPVTNGGDVDAPVQAVDAVPMPGSVASQESFNGYLEWRSSHPLAPSISLSPPPSTSVSSRPIATPPNHGRSPSLPSVVIDEDMRALRLSDPVATTRDNTTSSPAPATPMTASVEGGSATYSEPSPPGPATPRTTTTEEPSMRSSELSSPAPATPSTSTATLPGNVNGEPTPEAYSLIAMQAALDQDISHHPVTPEARSERQHLGPTSTPTPHVTSPRRRRSSSAIPQPRHEVSSESPPESRFHQPEFQEAFLSAKRLMSDLSDVLSSNQLHHEPDSTMKRLYDEARELSAFVCPDTRTVGFVGDSGVGKSSLINSLLDIRGLARTSASGAACTCVVTEYCYGEGDGFEVQVEYFDREELEKQIAELLGSYRHFHLSEELSEEEVGVYGEWANVAEDTFRAMFRGRIGDVGSVLLGGRDGGDDDERAAEGSEGEERVLRKLMSWVDDMPHSTTAGETFEDAESCSHRLMELTSDLGSVDEAALWPFIRKIRVSCNAHILSKGLILVDLPGLRDINSARRNIAERYILNCDEIFAVCNIIRAITDEGVMAVIELAKKASLANVGIICTRSDDIQAEEAKKDWKGTFAQSVRKLQDRVTVATQNLRQLEEEVREYEDIDVDDLLEEEINAYMRVRRRASIANKVLAQLEFELKEYLVSTRNDVVRRQLRETYAERIPGDDLPVFCVSNIDYWTYRDLPKDLSWDFLELSGMIEVRTHCISIVAESQHRAATLYMQRQIPALLDSLQLWVQSGSGSYSAERKIAIRHTLENVERTLRRGLTGANSGLHRPMIQACFQSFLANYQSKDIWARGAENAADEWSGWHWASYAAFCRNFGCHSTPAAGTHNWNEEAIGSMVFTLLPQWGELCRRIESQSSDATNVLRNLCEEAVGILVSDDQLDDDQIDVLVNSIRSHQSLLEAKLSASYDEVRRDLATLRTDVLSGIQTSFIGQAMESSYRACNRESGTGSDSRRKRIVNRRLHGEDVFTEMEMQLKGHFNTIAEDLMKQQMEATRAHFRAMKENLDMLRDENVVLESESDPEFRTRVDEEVRTVKDRLDRLLARL